MATAAPLRITEVNGDGDGGRDIEEAQPPAAKNDGVVQNGTMDMVPTVMPVVKRVTADSLQGIEDAMNQLAGLKDQLVENEQRVEEELKSRDEAARKVVKDHREFSRIAKEQMNSILSSVQVILENLDATKAPADAPVKTD